MIRIRKATLGDEASVIELQKQLASLGSGPLDERDIDWQKAAATFREMVRNEEHGTVLLADEDGDILGLITLSYPKAIRFGGLHTLIEEFIVTERARGKNVGSQLIEAGINDAASRGSHEMQVGNPSKLGYPVYLKHGLSDIGSHLLRKKL